MNNNQNDTLPDLMRRVTENLEPESTDLVERGMRRGVTLRRRRTALLSVSGAVSVLATAGIVVSGTQIFGAGAEAPVAGTATQSTKQPEVQSPVTKQETLTTLLKLLPPRLTVVKSEASGDAWGHSASVIVKDGKGASKLSMSVSSNDSTCFEPQPGTCTPRPDGSLITAYSEEPAYSRDNNPGGVLINSVTINRRGGASINLMSINAVEEKGVDKTRAKPALSVTELTAIADSKLWRFPPKPPVPTSDPKKPEPNEPGAGKPVVPVQQTLRTLKKVLPNGLQSSQPQTWGGGTGGFNGAAYLVNDGKGLSRVDALVTYEVPVTKCAPERATATCKVRPDGSVIGWTKEAPQYSDARQAKDGVLQNSVVIHYPDGRFISMSSYNAPAEKGSKHTRVKPALTTDQLLEMAGDKGWKFPGTGKK